MLNRKLQLPMLMLVAAGVASCRQDMHNQPRMRPYRESRQFADRTSARLPPSGTVARSAILDDELLVTGARAGSVANAYPFPITAAVLARGQQRFDIFCAPCHGLTGAGDGSVAQRGFFPRVANLHEDRLRFVALGYLFAVISKGFNLMPAYEAQLGERDRWAIIAYLRALQLSQHAPSTDLPPAQRQRLEGGAHG